MSRAQHKIHVLVTKPAVMTLAEHQELVRLADTHHVLVMVCILQPAIMQRAYVTHSM